MLFLLALSACAKEAPPIAVDSYCEKFVPKDFTDKGIRAQSDANIRADLANDNTHARDCRLKNQTTPFGPR